MKKILFSLGIVSMLSIAGCSEDFDVAAPYKNVTVVYGILNQADTAHYIRIQKAFLDESKSAVDMASEPDSSYYPELNVTIKEFHENGSLLRTTTAERVDLAVEGYPKNAPGPDAGFFTTPSYAYKFKWVLNSYTYYRVVIRNPQTGDIDSVNVHVVNSDPNNRGSGFFVNYFDQANSDLDFTSTAANAYFRFESATGIRGTMPENAKLVQGTLRFNYVDSNVTTGQAIHRSVDYVAASNLKVDANDDNFVVEALNNSLYSFLSANMGAAPANTERYMDKVDIYLIAADDLLYQYNQINLVQTSGLTATQIKPYYTNIKGTNTALGLVASRAYRTYYGAVITEPTLNVLKTLPSLNIKGRY